MIDGAYAPGSAAIAGGGQRADGDAEAFGSDRNSDDRTDAVTETRTVVIPAGLRRPKITLDMPSRVVIVVVIAKP